MVARDMEVEKVEDMAPNHTVDYVTDCTPNDNAEGKGEQRIVGFAQQNMRTVAMARASALNEYGVHGESLANRPKLTPRFQTSTILKNPVTSICRAVSNTVSRISHFVI